MNTNDCIIRPATPADWRATEELTREAFWDVYRPGCLEHYVLHVLRTRPERVPELDLVLERSGQLIGHIVYVRAVIEADDGRSLPILTFGPLSIASEEQGKGYGKLLLDASMEQARAMGALALCMEGNIDFYGHSGFIVASTRGIHYNDEPRSEEVPYFLLKELRPGALEGVSGTYRTPAAYFVEEEEAEAFDLTFPRKEKHRRLGQLV